MPPHIARPKINGNKENGTDIPRHAFSYFPSKYIEVGKERVIHTKPIYCFIIKFYFHLQTAHIMSRLCITILRCPSRHQLKFAYQQAGASRDARSKNKELRRKCWFHGVPFSVKHLSFSNAFHLYHIYFSWCSLLQSLNKHRNAYKIMALAGKMWNEKNATIEINEHMMSSWKMWAIWNYAKRFTRFGRSVMMSW